MIIKQATQVGNPIIRRKAVLAQSVTSKQTKVLVQNLIDSMRHHGLVGMAAPQIGVSRRIFVSEIRKTKNRTPKQIDALRVFINPRIIKSSKKKALGWEGCGSVAESGLFAQVSRATHISIIAFDGRGKKFILEAKGLLARIVQHEMDHLDGKVFLDRNPSPKSFMSRDEYLQR